MRNSRPLGMALAAAMLGAGILPALAQSQTAPGMSEAPELDEDISSVVLPMKRLIFSENNGEIRIISDNGRFVFQGTVFDTWEQEPIETLEDAQFSADHMDLEQADLDLSELKGLSYGSGDTPLTALVRPGEPASERLLRALADHESDLDARIIVYPSADLPDAAMVASACPVEETAAAQAFVSGEGRAELEYQDNCDGAVVQIRTITHYLLGYEDFPVVIRADTRVHSGAMDDWDQFLRIED